MDIENILLYILLSCGLRRDIVKVKQNVISFELKSTELGDSLSMRIHTQKGLDRPSKGRSRPLCVWIASRVSRSLAR